MVWARAMMAIAIMAALATQFATTVTGAAAGGRDVATTVVNFFSFFTVLSNVLAVVVLVAAAWMTARDRRAAEESAGLAFALAAAATYLIVTGVVYNLLLRGVELPQGHTVPWSNEVLHVVAPLFLLVDVLAGPRRRPLGWGTIAGILVFPLIWTGYTLIRGPRITSPLTGDPWWYPYPFLDPHLVPGGYLGVAGYVAAIAAAIGAVATFVVWWGRRR